jgi:methanogenic corrinoid protein MtbC1
MKPGQETTMGKAFRPFGTGSARANALAGGLPPAEYAPAGFPPAGFPPAWAEVLQSAIVTEILPILVSAQRRACRCGESEPAPRRLGRAEVAAFVALVVADDMEQARAVADRVIVQGGGRDALLHDLLTPAARLLGELWEADDCDFMTVTMGVYRLDQIMKETAAAGGESCVLTGCDRRILLVPAPGEQHSFGLSMVADTFREGGWCVRSGPMVTRPQLLRLVRDEWFDVIGLSVASDRGLKGLPSCIRAMRQASGNPRAYVMVGGRAMIEHPERTRFLGADVSVNDAHQALAQANIFVEATVTETLHQSMTRLVDKG